MVGASASSTQVNVKVSCTLTAVMRTPTVIDVGRANS